MPRKKMPKNLKLRKKLISHLLCDGKSHDYVVLVLGYSLSRSMAHLVDEHPNMLNAEFWRLYRDDNYRQGIVDGLLQKYGLTSQSFELVNRFNNKG